MLAWEEPEPVVVRALEALPSPRTTPVLEVGCGGGRHLVWLERHGFTGHGVDSSRAPLECARERLRSEGHPARVVLADARALPFAGGRFGAAIALDGLRGATHEELRLALGEIGRVLRGEGILLAALLSSRGDGAGHGCDEAGARALLAGFDVDSLALDEFYDDDGRLCSHWLAVASKRRP